MNQLRNIILVLFWPSRGLKAVMGLPRSLVVLLLFVASALAAHIVIQSKIDHDALARQVAQRQKMAPQGPEDNKPKEMTESELEEQTKRAQASMNIFGYFTIPLGILMKVFLGGLALYLVFVAWKKRVRFKTCWNLAAYICVPLILWYLLSIPVIVQYPSIDPQMMDRLFQTDLAYLMGIKDGVPILHWIDPVVIWIAVLFGLAGRAMGRGIIYCAIGGSGFWAALQVIQLLLTQSPKGV